MRLSTMIKNVMLIKKDTQKTMTHAVLTVVGVKYAAEKRNN